jgi:peptidoglycan hydrolase CwlO-like protein
MDESLFFFKDYNMPTPDEVNTKIDYMVCLTFTVGFWIGSIVTKLVNKCAMFNPDRKKIEDLYDTVEELEGALNTVTNDNESLEETVKKLNTVNGILIADEAAYERLIKKLQDEVQKLDHKNAGLESDACAYEVELAEFYNAARRKRLMTPSTSPAIIRKRHRTDNELDL